MLNIAAQSGIPGLISYLAVWFLILFYLFRRWRETPGEGDDKAAIAGTIMASVFFLTCSFTEAAFADEEVRQLLMLIWAIGLATTPNREPREGVVSKTT